MKKNELEECLKCHPYAFISQTLLWDGEGTRRISSSHYAQHQKYILFCGGRGEGGSNSVPSMTRKYYPVHSWEDAKYLVF